MLTSVWAPATATVGETFLWYNVDSKLRLGLALLWKQTAVRFLGNYELIAETPRSPNLRVGYGVQGIGVGNPGYFATVEKSVVTGGVSLNGFVGVGFRSNENHGHLLGGFKLSPKGPWTVGVQLDGHGVHPFVNYSIGRHAVGLYLIELKSPGVMLNFRW
ncbi:MAG: hypothetical protein HONBIEJF_00508 [Fimbriimonadaceae bacterium]|nr:hypothetical protein [Fimbriimonadaceae bacterium]